MKFESKYFTVRELVSKDVYTAFGDNAMMFIDPRLVSLLDFIREYFKKPMFVNNWHTNGTLNNRGFRDFDVTVGGKRSQHRYGRAADFNIVGLTPQEIYKTIMDNEDVFMAAGLTTVENIDFTPTWNHVDIRLHDRGKIWVVNP